MRGCMGRERKEWEGAWEGEEGVGGCMGRERKEWEGAWGGRGINESPTVCITLLTQGPSQTKCAQSLRLHPTLEHQSQSLT